MKDMSQVMLDRINADVLKTFLLYKIGPNRANPPKSLKYTSLLYDYVYNGDTYSSENRVVANDAPRLSDSLDKSSFKITLADPDGVLRVDLDDWKMQGAPFIIYVGIINNTNAPVVDGIYTIQPNQPFQSKLVAYEGTVDTFTYTITPDEEVILEVEGTSPMGALDLTRTKLTSKEYLQDRWPGDRSYDQVMEGSNQLLLKWGKASWR